MPQNGILQGKAEMKRIYERAAEWLCGIGSDKYVHLLTCLLITFAAAVLVRAVFHEDGCVSAGTGACAAMATGFFKERWDNFTTGDFNFSDLAFDAAGCLTGAVMLCTWTAVA